MYVHTYIYYAYKLALTFSKAFKKHFKMMKNNDVKCVTV